MVYAAGGYSPAARGPGHRGESNVHWLRRYIGALQNMPPTLASKPKLDRFLTEPALKYWALCFQAHKPGSSCPARLRLGSGIQYVSSFLPTGPRDSRSCLQLVVASRRPVWLIPRRASLLRPAALPSAPVCAHRLGARTGRKPRPAYPLPGESLFRPAVRLSAPLLIQLPPRNPRNEPVFGPRGSTTLPPG